MTLRVSDADKNQFVAFRNAHLVRQLLDSRNERIVLIVNNATSDLKTIARRRSAPAHTRSAVHRAVNDDRDVACVRCR
jgi:hypothetical protein